MKRILLFILLLISGCATIDNYKSDFDIKKLPASTHKIQQQIIKDVSVNDNKSKVVGMKSNIELKGVSVGDVIKVIYGEALKVPYVVAQDVSRLDNKIDISIKKNTSHADLVLIIKSALQMVGVQVIEKNGCHFLSIPLDKEKLANLDKDEKKIVSVLSLEYQSPLVLMPILEKILIPLYPSFTWSASAGVVYFVSEKSTSEQIKQIIQNSDIPEKQIFVEVQILECLKEGALSNGLMSYLSLSVEGLKTAFSFGTAKMLSGLTQLSLITNADTFSNILGILQTDKIIKNVANPFLVVRSGKLSTLAMGDEIPILGSTVTNSQGQSEKNIIYRKTGITLDVTPIIIGDLVYLDISVSTSNGDVNKLSNIDSPSISNRSIKSSVKLSHNQAVILGGISSNKNSFNQSGLPFINKLFKRYINQNDRQNVQTELLVFLRPIILDNNSDFILDEKQKNIISSIGDNKNEL